LLDGVVPLHINFAKDSIVAMMPHCNTHGVEANWPLPTLEIELEWASNLMEKASRKETDLTWATRDEELAYIASRVEEIVRINATGGSGTAAVEDDDDEEH
jgi:hypothetical protein